MKRNTKLVLLSCLALAVFAGMAFAADRDTPRVEFATSSVTAAEQIDTGWIVGTRSGYGYKYLSSSTNLVVLGISQNGGASNAVIHARSGIFGMKNNGSVTAAYIGGNAYAATNNTGYTVGPTGSGTAVGKIVAVDSDYVWVKLGF
jgi:hypothetical protein